MNVGSISAMRRLSFLKTPSGRCPGRIIPENSIWLSMAEQKGTTSAV